MNRNHMNNSGVVLIMVLWILVILTTLAVSLGRSSMIELSLAKHSIGKLKAKYMAWAGLNYAKVLIQSDSLDSNSKNFDTLYSCGITANEEKELQDVFAQKIMGDGYFDISYDHTEEDYSSSSVGYGLMDEERKININGLTANNKDILKFLIVALEFDEIIAEEIASSVVDWKDIDDFITGNDGAEDAYYMDLESPYHVKNLPFDSKEELLLVKGVTKEIYDKIKEYITVFPKQGSLAVNFDTASKAVLQALTRSFTGAQTNTIESDADSLVNKLIEHRKGDDGESMTYDDALIDINNIELNAKERAIFLSMNPYRTKISNFLRVNVFGMENNLMVSTNIDAVVARENLAILSFYRN